MQIFDPLGLSEGADPGEIKKWREAEIKHGRVAMLATVGVLVAEVRVPSITSIAAVIYYWLLWYYHTRGSSSTSLLLTVCVGYFGRA